MALNKETENKISQLQMLEQGLSTFNAQKHQLQTKILEIESALAEIEKTDVTYKILGNIMVRTDKEALKTDLDSQKATANIRIKAVEKQENSIREKAKKLQDEIMKSMGDD